MNYLAALNKSTCDVVQPVKQVVEVIIKQENVTRCMGCSIKLNKPGLCAKCTKFGLAYSKCDSCEVTKLTFCGCCKECIEEIQNDDKICSTCKGDQLNKHGQCIDCLDALYNENGGW